MLSFYGRWFALFFLHPFTRILILPIVPPTPFDNLWKALLEEKEKKVNNYSAKCSALMNDDSFTFEMPKNAVEIMEKIVGVLQYDFSFSILLVFIFTLYRNTTSIPQLTFFCNLTCVFWEQCLFCFFFDSF